MPGRRPYRSRERSKSPSIEGHGSCRSSNGSLSSRNSSPVRSTVRLEGIPRKVPISYAYELLQEYAIDHPNGLVRIVNLSDMERIAEDREHTIVRLAKLQQFFYRARDFRTFKREYFRNIPNEYWEDVVRENPRNRPYVRKYLPSFSSKKN
ncbi:hypothetical protein AVEN_261792-1 [Araneus ventricosus]|uniref:Uncharacterized protein n=1 Tax=Araneus ventricosus TaxID=182803 RepID=A0A4Y2LY40_ARAVE|nr:hypothetical protein AVEN_261792-1 [Araneus ventricosus]